MQTTTIKDNPSVIKKDELILVVKRDCLFNSEPTFQGLVKVNFDDYLNIINNNKEFLPRSLMEQDFSYKQIIPYLVFMHENKLFLMQRQSKASETRLASKYSLGIGGHINQEDMTTDSIIDWARREFHEEVDFKGKLEIQPIGILNDDSQDVGKVHIGFVYLLTGDTNEIKVHSELKSGELLTFKECELYYEKMESWSKLVFDFLKVKFNV